MGRIKIKKPSRQQIKRQARVWGLPLVLSFLIFLAYLSVVSQKHTSSFKNFVSNNNMKVGTETKGNYQQIYYEYNNKKIFVTDDDVNHTNPRIYHEYIVWTDLSDGRGQTVIYNIFDRTATKLSFSGDSQRPMVYKGRVAWERFVDAKPQIFYYDGVKVQQMSNNYASVRPALNDTKLAYAQQNNKGWQVVSHDLNTGEEEIIPVRDEAYAWPHFSGDRLKTYIYE